MGIMAHTFGEIVIRTTIIYFVILIGFRLTGKRQVGQMTPFDLALLLLIANAVQNAMTGPDTSLSGGIVAAVTLLIANALVSRVVWRHRRVRRWLEGTPRLLIHKGRIVMENLEREKVTIDELHQALREHGIVGVSDVGLAVLEVDGTISVLKNDEIPAPTRPHHRIRLSDRK